jgi:hypothetical protein
MMAYGASRLACDPEECIRLINRYLDDPTLDADGRERAREEDCGPLDGKAGERIATVLQSLSQGRRDVSSHRNLQTNPAIPLSQAMGNVTQPDEGV